jgi:hypothetical protein
LPGNGLTHRRELVACRWSRFAARRWRPARGPSCGRARCFPRSPASSRAIRSTFARRAAHGPRESTGHRCPLVGAERVRARHGGSNSTPPRRSCETVEGVSLLPALHPGSARAVPASRRHEEPDGLSSPEGHLHGAAR